MHVNLVNTSYFNKMFIVYDCGWNEPIILEVLRRNQKEKSLLRWFDQE